MVGFGYIWKVELIGFADVMDAGCEEGVKDGA